MRIAIITGASSGLGREFARQIPRLYKHLDEIWVIARREERLKDLAPGLSVSVRVFAQDLLEDDVYENISSCLKDYHPDIRMLVNAAGYGKIGEFQEIEEKEQLGMVQLNCEALTRMTKICLPYMSAGSRIINLASAAAFGPQPEFAVYAASKSYVYSFSNALRSELKNQEIYVTSVCPGPVDTEFFEHTGEERPASVKDKLFVEAKNVVKKALIDSKKKRAVSVYGFPMKAARTASGMIPDPCIARLFQKMNDKKH